jgi:hypothetical protein
LVATDISLVSACEPLIAASDKSNGLRCRMCHPWLHPLALPESPIIGSNTETKENLFATNLELPCLIYLEQQGSSCGISIYPKRRKKVGLRPQTFRIIFSDSNNVDRLLAGIKKVLCSFLFMCVDMGIRICLCCHICAT